MLEGCGSIADLGECVVPGLHAAEVNYLRRHEYALDARDILWRRSKLALHLPPGSDAVLDAWLARHPT
jgi:glycerol-3-phosphate dehydrogenase